jgi:hypothetical protein
MALKMYRSGNSDPWYILAMSLAAIVAVAIVAPGMFSGEHREPGDWSQEIRSLKAKVGSAKQGTATEASAPATTGEGRDGAG